MQWEYRGGSIALASEEQVIVCPACRCFPADGGVADFIALGP